MQELRYEIAWSMVRQISYENSEKKIYQCYLAKQIMKIIMKVVMQIRFKNSYEK